MLSSLFLKTSSFKLGGALIVSTFLTVSTGAGKAATLDPTVVDQAIQYLGVVRGAAISKDGQAWLQQRWLDELSKAPKHTTAQIDHLAVLLEQHEDKKDMLALANSRADLLKNLYCTAAQSSDPNTARLRDILAPEELVLAADCALGLVVTRFDVEGLTASHALIATASGQDYDAEREATEAAVRIKDWFPGAGLAEKELVARAEIRHAVLARFWSRIEGTPEQQALIDALRDQAKTDPKGPARELENLAISKLGEVDYLAKVGDDQLKAAMIGSYIEFLERIAGDNLSSRDRAWLQDVFIRDFHDGPKKTLTELNNVQTLNRNYRASRSADEQAKMTSDWAARLYCHLTASDDRDEQQLASVLFDHDPVTFSDCDAMQISRKSQTILAEAAGHSLTEADVGDALRFASIMLGRPLLPAEEAVVREDSMQSFDRDFSQWLENREFYRAFLGEIDQRRDSMFLAMDKRKELFDPIYCGLTSSDEPFSEDYVRMFQRHEAILFEDCEVQRVTTKSEIDAFIGVLSFLALINGTPPLSQAEIAELPARLVSRDLNRAESMLLALDEWWSLLSLEEKVTAIKSMREQGIAPDADAKTISSFLNHIERMIVVLNARNKSCETLAITIQGMTALYGASLGPSSVTGSNPSGVPGEQLAGLVSASNAARAICKGVYGG